VRAIGGGGGECGSSVRAAAGDVQERGEAGRVGGAGVSSAPLQPDNDKEDSKPRPLERKAVARREAKESWLRFGDEAGVCVHVFHLGGIYGPGRSKVPHQGVGLESTEFPEIEGVVAVKVESESSAVQNVPREDKEGAGVASESSPKIDAAGLISDASTGSASLASMLVKDEPGDPQAGELRASDDGDLQVVKTH
jgi:hypothetical protein